MDGTPFCGERLESLLELIDQGFQNAVHPDRKTNGCIL